MGAGDVARETLKSDQQSESQKELLQEGGPAPHLEPKSHNYKRDECQNYKEIITRGRKSNTRCISIATRGRGARVETTITLRELLDIGGQALFHTHIENTR